ISAKGEADVGGEQEVVVAWQDLPVGPRAAAVKRGVPADLEAVMGGIGEELGPADQMQWVMRILRQHRLAVREEDIVADAHVGDCRACFGPARAASVGRSRGGWRAEQD